MNMNEFKNMWEEMLETEVQERTQQLQNQNDVLKKRVKEQEVEISHLRGTSKTRERVLDNAITMTMMIDTFKERYNAAPKGTKDELVYTFLRCFYEPDFEESTYDCPLWLGAVTNFYSNRDVVIQFLRALEVKLPDNVESFRLPHEWTEEELDEVFNTMPKHIVCNSCTYGDNLRFWAPNALYPVQKLCNCGMYTEIPWQFLLRNPLLLQEKYLSKIGKMAFDQSSVNGWRYLSNIDKYLALTEEHLKLILDNLNPYALIEKDKFKSVNEFLLRHLSLITNKCLLDSIYKEYKDTYDFRYGAKVLQMPGSYVADWITGVPNPLQWLETHHEKLTEEQRKALTTIVVQRYLK